VDTIAIKVAARWLMARGPLWEEFLREVYEGGKMMVRNTNRDTKDRYPKVEAATLLKTDKKFRKLVRGQFERWKVQRERQGPRGEAVESLADLKPGQTLEWTQGKTPRRGEVQQARGNRAILKMQDGSIQHMRQWDLQGYQPRVVS
jgi:hypothetical protein